MICNIDFKYDENVLANKSTGKRNIYAKLTKAAHDTLLMVKLFYKKLSAQLIDWGFEPNDFDKCTFNKMVNRA